MKVKKENEGGSVIDFSISMTDERGTTLGQDGRLIVTALLSIFCGQKNGKFWGGINYKIDEHDTKIICIDIAVTKQINGQVNVNNIQTDFKELNKQIYKETDGAVI